MSVFCVLLYIYLIIWYKWLKTKSVFATVSFEFQLNHNAAETHRNLYAVFDEDCYSQLRCRFYFNRFRNGDFSLGDHPRPGRSLEIDEALRSMLKDEPYQSTRELASRLGCNQYAIVRHLAKLGFSQKLGKWVPHRISDDQKEHRTNICSSLLSRIRRFDWLRNVITRGEKWVLYVNHSRKRQ